MSTGKKNASQKGKSVVTSMFRFSCWRYNNGIRYVPGVMTYMVIDESSYPNLFDPTMPAEKVKQRGFIILAQPTRVSDLYRVYGGCRNPTLVIYLYTPKEHDTESDVIYGAYDNVPLVPHRRVFGSTTLVTRRVATLNLKRRRDSTSDWWVVETGHQNGRTPPYLAPYQWTNTSDETTHL